MTLEKRGSGRSFQHKQRKTLPLTVRLGYRFGPNIGMNFWNSGIQCAI